MWCKLVEDYENYILTNTGAVWSRTKNKWMKIQKNPKSGYLQIKLQNKKGSKNFNIHQLVYHTFARKTDPNIEEVHHKDRDRENCNLSNLICLTKQQHHQQHKDKVTEEQKKMRSEKWSGENNPNYKGKNGNVKDSVTGRFVSKT